MTAYLDSQYYVLQDGYERIEETRHDLKKGFKFFLEHVRKDLYEPYIKRVETQNLFKDKMFDEYLEKINDNNRFLA